MQKKEPDQVDLARRDFLLAAGGTGALGAIAVLVGQGMAVEVAPTPATTDVAPIGNGYRETEHIRKYYRSAQY